MLWFFRDKDWSNIQWVVDTGAAAVSDMVIYDEVGYGTESAYF